MVSEHTKTLPILWGHGEVDPLIALKLAIESKEFLNSQKGLGHSVRMQELEDFEDVAGEGSSKIIKTMY